MRFKYMKKIEDPQFENKAKEYKQDIEKRLNLKDIINKENL